MHFDSGSADAGREAPELLVSGAELPFEHKLTAMQRQQIEAADLVVWTGPELEPFMQEVITGLKGKPEWWNCSTFLQ